MSDQPLEDSPGRLPLLDQATLDHDQRRVYDTIVAGAGRWATQNGFTAVLDDGRLAGPFNGFLYAPALSEAYNAWVGVEQQGTVISERVRQIVILTVGVAWGADYEIYAHTAVARNADLPDAVIEAVLHPAGATADFAPDEAAANAFSRALVVTKRVDDATFAAAVEQFGYRGVVHITHLIGQYLATSALLNAFAVPVPATGSSTTGDEPERG